MSSNEEEYFDILGISLISRNYEILKTIQSFTEEQGIPPTFNDIENRVNATRNESFSKQWIYKCLSDLEEEGMISIDRINKPTTYAISLLSLRAGLDRLVLQKLKELEESKKEIIARKEEILSESTYNLAFHLVDTLSGKRIEKPTGVIEGVDNIRRFILLEICELSKPGDIVRANKRLEFIESKHDETIVSIERSILETITKGVKIKALLAHHSLEEAYQMANLRDLFEREATLFQQAISSELIDIRSPTEDLMPYRIIALNNDKMFMFLSDSGDPDTVALIFREDNPALVDDAIERFDAIFNSGTKINEDVISDINETL